MDIETRIAALESRLAALEGERKEGKGDPKRRMLPVNKVAYEKAFSAWLAGDRKAMKEYKQHYRVPA